MVIVDSVRRMHAGIRRMAFRTGKAAKARRSLEKQYYETDNLGTRQESMDQAAAYWKGVRARRSVMPPYTLFTFPSAEQAESALLELPFIHKAEDSGKLICDRLMTYGFYETTRNGAPTGQYQALLTGSDLTAEEFRLAETAFSRHQGECSAHDAPAAPLQGVSAGEDAAQVRYSEVIRGYDGVSIYEVYNGPDKASAMAFLRGKPVSRRYYYVIVDTPEGSFGRDMTGLYRE